jgi:hypothetical protein
MYNIYSKNTCDVQAAIIIHVPYLFLYVFTKDTFNFFNIIMIECFKVCKERAYKFEVLAMALDIICHKKKHYVVQKMNNPINTKHFLDLMNGKPNILNYFLTSIS